MPCIVLTDRRTADVQPRRAHAGVYGLFHFQKSTEMEFKVHMVFYSDEESFSTLCGIDNGCSERFYENCGRYLVEFGNDKKTTCKKCLSRFKKMVTKHDSEVAALTIPA